MFSWIRLWFLFSNVSYSKTQYNCSSHCCWQLSFYLHYFHYFYLILTYFVLRYHYIASLLFILINFYHPYNFASSHEKDMIPDICTHQLISSLSTNYLVVEASISYVEHVHHTPKFSHHFLHEERQLGIVLSCFIKKNKRVLIIWRGPLHTPQNLENYENW